MLAQPLTIAFLAAQEGPDALGHFGGDGAIPQELPQGLLCMNCGNLLRVVSGDNSGDGRKTTGEANETDQQDQHAKPMFPLVHRVDPRGGNGEIRKTPVQRGDVLIARISLSHTTDGCPTLNAICCSCRTDALPHAADEMLQRERNHHNTHQFQAQQR